MTWSSRCPSATSDPTGSTDLVDGELVCLPDRGEARAPFVELDLNGARAAVGLRGRPR